MKRLIVTGDDFGASLPVNEAIERAHRQGILNTASLMVGAPAAADAVARAGALPGLGVGLHLVLVCGRPLSPPEDIPDLIGADGAFATRLVRAGFSFFFRPAVRRQLAAEIRAQFERFHATGLDLDHVNAHNHMHMHPTILGLILRIGADYGLRAVRMPHEPFLASWRATGEGLARRWANDVLLRPLIRAHRRRLARAGVVCNDYVFGMNDNGCMDRRRLLAFLDHLPDGVTEIFCHPATAPWPEMEPAARHYRVADELAALTDTAVAAAIGRLGIRPVGFREITQ
ncbi:MAG: hopanoid biosynthesis-associated protein HpnK [Proteobacteria bacterium]|nr:hopanoid biosynthesis-associated protein HpnK [Pseudomonadota bacterium]